MKEKERWGLENGRGSINLSIMWTVNLNFKQKISIGWCIIKMKENSIIKIACIHPHKGEMDEARISNLLITCGATEPSSFLLKISCVVLFFWRLQRTRNEWVFGDMKVAHEIQSYMITLPKLYIPILSSFRNSHQTWDSLNLVISYTSTSHYVRINNFQPSRTKLFCLHRNRYRNHRFSLRGLSEQNLELNTKLIRLVLFELEELGNWKALNPATFQCCVIPELYVNWG